MKFVEVPEEIVINSDIAIKQEVLEPTNNDPYDVNYHEQNYYEQNYYDQNSYWPPEYPEEALLESKPVKKKRKRKQKEESQIKSEGGIKVKSEGEIVLIFTLKSLVYTIFLVINGCEN